MIDSFNIYKNRALNAPSFWDHSDYKNVSPELMAEVRREIFVPRNTFTDFSSFIQKFGFDLPDDLKDYVNLCWHTYIYGFIDFNKKGSKGFYKFDESIILFSVLRNINESDNDILFQKNGLIEMTEELYDDWGDEAQEYIPIGWSGYSAFSVLYKRSTGKIYLQSQKNDCLVDDEPIADSLSDLIEKLNFNS